MNAEGHLQARTTCAIELSSSIVDAGAEIAIVGKVSCDLPCDLRGEMFLVKDQDGALVASIELTEYVDEDETNQTAEFAARAPVTAGEYTWSALFSGYEDEDISIAESSAPFSFTVRSHVTTVLVWDVPPTVVMGEKFKIKVGVKCSSQCPMGHRELSIHDHEGVEAATGVASEDIWPKSAALYFTELEIVAPDTEGLLKWEARTPEADIKVAGSDAKLPHGGGLAAFDIRCVSPPEFKVTVEAYDREKQTPLSGAIVVMHPYRSVTNEHGVAEVRVAKGQYRLFVSSPKYLNFGTPVEVAGDLSTRAELSVAPPPDRE
jgi:hypothetical protein